MVPYLLKNICQCSYKDKKIIAYMVLVWNASDEEV